MYIHCLIKILSLLVPIGGAAPAAAPAPEATVEEVDPMEGGMDMFGGGDADY
jgi:hypothetical protein